MTPSATSTAPASSSRADALIALVREASLLESTASILGWDQETMMPPRGIALRSRQLAQLARMAHAAFTDPRVGDAIAACEADAEITADPLSVDAVNVREIRRAYDRATRLPASLVEELARTTSMAQHEWAEARRDNDFARFRPWLESIVRLVRQKANCYGVPHGGELWDALADEYEPGATAAAVSAVFGPLRVRLQALVGELDSAPRKPSDRFNEFPLPIPQQEKLNRFIAETLGFDFTRGRLDRSTHPFCGGSHCNDVRLTTRYKESCVNDALGSTMHEAGHGMYEQGLLEAHVGTPMGRSVSLGIHEGQSRMWENQVGRSRVFWSWLAPRLPEFFGDAVRGFSLEELYEAANIVEPGFIRVEADEATYNLHVMIRFEIERALIGGELEPAAIPSVWNVKYREYLGLVVPDDRRGCLQDIHWSMGSIGYFPTYTLGNLYAAQFFEAARREMPELDASFAAGRFDPLLTWLNRKIHQQGMRHPAATLCELVTGAPLSPEPLMRHLEGKLRPLYGL
jgi:carboxypeptidase Taq